MVSLGLRARAALRQQALTWPLSFAPQHFRQPGFSLSDTMAQEWPVPTAPSK